MIVILMFCQFSLADSLYAHGYYDLAAIEYKRVFFFYPELKNNQHRRLNFAISLLKIDELKGLQELNNILDDFAHLEPELKITMAKQYINLENYYQAARVLSQTEEKNLLGYTYLLNNKLSSARNLYVANGSYELAKRIDEYMRQPMKSTRTAVLLSFICPGAGEIYAGNIKLGVMDFLLNLGSGYLFYNAMRQKKYVDAILIFNFLFHRFYLGSIYNAQKSAVQWNENCKEKWLNELKNKYFQPKYFDYGD